MKRISWVICPKCQEYTDQKVRRSDRNSKHVIVRRRECFKCSHIWHTIQYPEMIVVWLSDPALQWVIRLPDS
jgi:transcriptional regulator NrdR family protein